MRLCLYVSVLILHCSRLISDQPGNFFCIWGGESLLPVNHGSVKYNSMVEKRSEGGSIRGGDLFQGCSGSESFQISKILSTDI